MKKTFVYLLLIIDILLSTKLILIKLNNRNELRLNKRISGTSRFKMKNCFRVRESIIMGRLFNIGLRTTNKNIALSNTKQTTALFHLLSCVKNCKRKQVTNKSKVFNGFHLRIVNRVVGLTPKVCVRKACPRRITQNFNDLLDEF